MARTTPLARLSASEIQAELRRRQRATRTLARRRARLSAKLDALDRQIELLGGSVNGHVGRGRRRAKNEMTLADALAKVLKGKPMGVSEAAEAVQRFYRTTSRNFRTQVNIALIKGGFKRVGRGRYVAKG